MINRQYRRRQTDRMSPSWAQISLALCLSLCLSPVYSGRGPKCKVKVVPRLMSLLFPDGVVQGKTYQVGQSYHVDCRRFTCVKASKKLAIMTSSSAV